MQVGRAMAERSPALVTVTMSKRKRHGRVFADTPRKRVRASYFRSALAAGPGVHPRSIGRKSIQGWPWHPDRHK